MTTRNVDIFIRQAIDNYKKKKKKKKKKKERKKERRKKLTHEHEQGLIYKHRPYYCFLFLTNLQYVSLMLLNIKKKKQKNIGTDSTSKPPARSTALEPVCFLSTIDTTLKTLLSASVLAFLHCSRCCKILKQLYIKHNCFLRN
jgi:hypothetical protein